ncbi:hypothetical protein [Sorangium sp. So ce1389]|uniref:hypothetical protein n=1 Tax=Sorangium sp. So ce1389 TaxID=3133336 RepID=UPI003F613D3F
MKRDVRTGWLVSMMALSTLVVACSDSGGGPSSSGGGSGGSGGSTGTTMVGDGGSGGSGGSTGTTMVGDGGSGGSGGSTGTTMVGDGGSGGSSGTTMVGDGGSGGSGGSGGGEAGGPSAMQACLAICEAHKLYGCDPPDMNCADSCGLVVIPLSRPACEDELVAYYSCWLPEASTCKEGLPAHCQDEKDAYSACVDAHGCRDLKCEYPHGLEGNECACSSTCLRKEHEVKCGPSEDGTTMCSCFVEGVEVGTCEGAPREVCHLTQGCCQEFFDIP